jgi:hypothetical protein
MQALAAYSDFIMFRVFWEKESYFNSGFLLGKSIVQGLVVAYLILMANQAINGGG